MNVTGLDHACLYTARRKIIGNILTQSDWKLFKTDGGNFKISLCQLLNYILKAILAFCNGQNVFNVMHSKFNTMD